MKKKQSLDPESKYHHLFVQSRDAITIVTTDGTFLEVNPAFTELTGYSRDELQYMNAAELWVSSQERKIWRKLLEKEGSLIEYESEQRRKDGTSMNLLLTTSTRTDEHGNTIFQTILRDITAKKKAESEREELLKKLQAALEQVRHLEKILPLCSLCRKIRIKGGSSRVQDDWVSLEKYVHTHTDSKVSHAICPDCMAKYYPENSE